MERRNSKPRFLLALPVIMALILAGCDSSAMEDKESDLTSAEIKASLQAGGPSAGPSGFVWPDTTIIFTTQGDTTCLETVC